MKFIRFLVGAVLVWCALVEVAEFVAGRLFNMEIDGDWFLMLVASDAAELKSFFRTYSIHLTIGLVTFLGLAVLSVAYVRRLRPKHLPWLALAFAAYAGVGIWQSGYWRAWKPLYVTYDTVRSTSEFVALARAGRWTPERASSVRPAVTNAPNLVIVIGESLTSDRMPLYGYSKRTMPNLEARRDEVAVLGPLRAPSPYTARSLMAMLVRNGETAAVAFRKAGYYTALISAQGHWERYCGVEQMVFAACETRRYLDGDDKLSGALREEIVRAGGRPFVCFVHMTGSHFNPGDRVPTGFALNEGLDDYDRSVRYTDQNLDSIIASLAPHTVLVFTSDHGESVDCSGWRNMRSSSLWRVPLIVWPGTAAAGMSDIRDFTEIWYNFTKR